MRRTAVPHTEGLAKLRVHASGDRDEQEADRIARRVSGPPEPLALARCACGGSCPHCAARPPAQGAVVGDALRDSGQALDPRTRSFMETRLGHDFSDVRVHVGKSAAESADAIYAHAYTVGSHIVFGAERFDTDSGAGRRLLAHELAHVVQQRRAGRPALQRQEKKDEAKDKGPQAAPAQPDPASAYYHLVVRDRGLDLGGGVLVTDLAAAKATMRKRKVDKPWTLVLAIHASENRLGAQAPPDWQKNAVFYDAEDIKKLFGGDSAFVAWRDQYGPSRVVLYGCQVTAAFEQVIADNLTRGGKTPSAGGLGEGCKPLATTVTFGVNSRAKYDKLIDAEKENVLSEVQTANRTWGYYGGPPVPNNQVLDYLFQGPKPGSWPQVEVIYKDGDDFVSGKPPMPYWNRLSNSTYLQKCDKAVGNLREHKPRAPGDKDSE